MNWNTGHALRDCLNSIPASLRADFELQRVNVVDNASSDYSIDCLGDLNLPCVIQRNPLNRGFAAACNQGAAGNTADYLLFLNPDTRLTPNSLCNPVRLMEEPGNRDLGICGISLVDDSGTPGTSYALFPTPGLICGESVGLHKLLPHRFDRLRTAAQDSGSWTYVDQVIGAFFLVRSSLFELLNGFDSRFFVYYEEVDFSVRARKAGFRSCVLLDTLACHIGCLSSNNVKDKRLFYLLDSRLKYVRKHFGIFSWLSVWVSTLTLEPLARGLNAILKGSFEELRALFSAYRFLIRTVVTRIFRKLRKRHLPGQQGAVRTDPN